MYYGKLCFYKIGLNFTGDGATSEDLNSAWLDPRSRELNVGAFYSFDDFIPRAAMMCGGKAAAIFATKAPTKGRADQELHLIKLATAPEEISTIFHGRCAIQGDVES